MNLDDTLKNIILEKVLPEISTLNVNTRKSITKIVEIEDGQNLKTLTETVSEISKEYNIDVDKIYIGIDQDYDGGKFCAYFDLEVDKTSKEIETELSNLIERRTWKIIFDNITKKGFRRIGFNTSLLKSFDDTSVHMMIKNNAIDRLVSYYSFRYVANSN